MAKKKTARKPSRRKARPKARVRGAGAPGVTVRGAGAPGVTKDRRVNPKETLRMRAIEPSFTVNDLARSLEFYKSALGFVVDEEYKGPDGRVQGVMLKAGTCRLGLSQDDWAKGRDRQKGVGVRVWCTTVQDIDALANRIRTAGHGLAEEPKEQPWGGRTLAVDDPDGFHITVYRP